MEPSVPEQAKFDAADANNPGGSLGPRLNFDQLLAQLIDRAQDVMAAQSRLRGLLQANQSIVGDLELPTVLQRIVQASCKLVDAPYGALGVIGPEGGLEQFITSGIDDRVAARIGHLPEGNGLLGALIDDPRPIRLRSLSDDIRSVGLPPHHPPMLAFLGVPIRIRGAVFGNLYLTRDDDRQFSVEDEELVTSLAASAGVAIENARLFEESRRKQEWLAASTEITQQLLASAGKDPLLLIAERIQRVADADAVNVVLRVGDGERLMIEVAIGAGSDQLREVSYPMHQTVSGLVMETGQPVLIDDVSDHGQLTVHLSEVVDVGPLMALPFGRAPSVRGAVLVARLHGRGKFSPADLNVAAMFADYASVALELTTARAAQQRVELLEDRDRIARDLHDHVIQQLFASGLTLQGLATSDGSGIFANRLTRVVSDIDDTIRQIRASIFELRGPLAADTADLRMRVMDIAAQVAPLLGFQPRLRFVGPLDAGVPFEAVDDLAAVVREALTNTARHAHAHQVSVRISATANEVSVDVTDDGDGIANTSRYSGLRNLRERAKRHGGELVITSPLPHPSAGQNQRGTTLLWTIPLP